VPQFESKSFVIKTRIPIKKREVERWKHGTGLKLDTMAVIVKILE
jgi:hypothetical protein